MPRQMKSRFNSSLWTPQNASKRVGLTLLTISCLGLAQCSTPKAEQQADPTEVATQQALLRQLAEKVIQPSIASFASEAQRLDVAVKAWCPALSGDATKAAALKKDAQDAWLSTAKAWQRLIPMAIGPHADADMAEAIDSWPLVNPCAVDQGVNALLEDGTIDIVGRLPNQKGLDALETLLFRASLKHLCPPQAAPAGWDERSDSAKTAARCAYAEVVSSALLKRATTLEKAWEPGPASYIEVLSAAGNDATAGAVWASSHAALNALTDAVLSLETYTKGRRLGAPLGIAANPCGTIGAPCSKALESPWAHQGSALLRANLGGARAILLGVGNDGQAFDDWLVRKGASPAATSMKTHLDETKAAFDALPAPLQDGLVSDEAKVKAAYDALGKLTHHVETQLLVALSLQVPDSVAGDSD